MTSPLGAPDLAPPMPLTPGTSAASVPAATASAPAATPAHAGDRHAPSIWWWAFGYFACYVPYSALTKLLSGDRLATGDGPVQSLELLAPSALASVATMLIFLVATGWWRHAGRRQLFGRAVPCPRRLTLLSGLCSTGIIATTTLAYSFSGVSMVLVALLMRGGVLVIAPIIDRLTHRRVRATSWIALALSLLSLLVAMTSSWRDARMPLLAAIDLACYLGFYFTRLTLMSRSAKTDPATNLRYFVEESLVSSPALLVVVALGALLLDGEVGRQLTAGFTSFFSRPVWMLGLIVGITSQGTGIFGGLVFLDPREASFCVPVNRASSVLAVLVASLLLVATVGAAAPRASEWLGAAILLVALAILAFSPRPAAASSPSPPLRTSG